MARPLALKPHASGLSKLPVPTRFTSGEVHFSVERASWVGRKVCDTRFWRAHNTWFTATVAGQLTP